MRLLILGPPGAGKGTQAARIAEHFGIPAVSTGDIFRANIKNETELGLQVKSILASGGFVSDEVTNAIVADRLAQDDCQAGFLLDGYPRTLPQVAALDELLASKGQTLEHVLEQRAGRTGGRCRAGRCIAGRPAADGRAAMGLDRAGIRTALAGDAGLAAVVAPACPTAWRKPRHFRTDLCCSP